MAESKETKPQEDGEKNLPPTLEGALDDDEKTLTHESSPKSKKKKKKSKLRNLLSREPNEEIPLAEVDDAISSSTLEEKKSLSNEEAMKLEMIIKKMNEMMPGGRKEMADHKFWSTQPVIKFGIDLEGYLLIVGEMVFEEGQIDKPQPESVRKEPLHVPGNFEFVEMDINNDSDVFSQCEFWLTVRFKRCTSSSLVIMLRMKKLHSDSHTLRHSSNGTISSC
jgi:glycylpeptide N-tetradecanoyltransferase